jgi:S-adenosylmethionine:tRNA ribosyltransferase-isomerase
MVVRPDRVEHKVFRDLGGVLDPGDLVVVNNSVTLPAAVDGILGSEPCVVHFSAELDDGTWVVELRLSDRSGPLLGASPGEEVTLPEGRSLTLLAGHLSHGRFGTRLWQARSHPHDDVRGFLARHGRPISYGYLHGRWPLEAYQTIFAEKQGSAEMPSAARPFTDRLVTKMVARGITFAPVTLHCGVSSLEAGEPPQPERFEVPATTAWLVNQTRRAGRRVVAVGTTVTRALETVAGPKGRVDAGAGWTELILGPSRPARVVDALITGWHPPLASHLLLLEAIAGTENVQCAYDAAVAHRYLWHEFGDSCLFLPPKG